MFRAGRQMIEERPKRSPPSTDSNRQVCGPSASWRYTDSGVSRSDSTSRTTGTRTRMPGARGSGACGDCGDGDADLVTRRFLGGRMGGVDGGCMPPSPTQVGKNAVRECAGVHAPTVAALRSEEHTSELQSLMRI